MFMMFIFLPLFLFMILYFMYFKVINSPLIVMLMLIFYSLLFSYLIFLNMKNYFYNFMILISYVSGVMVLFMYFISLMNLFKNKFLEGLTYLLIFTMFVTFMCKENFNLQNYNLIYLNLYNYYSFKNLFILVSLMFLLSVMLYVCYKICYQKNKPLRKL